MPLDPWSIPQPAGLQPVDFAGRYSIYDDGWAGTLWLEHRGGRKLDGTYHGIRFEAYFEVTAEVDERKPHLIELTIHDFNWQDEQLFIGYLFASTKNTITGCTMWREQPYGFVARKSRFLTLASFRSGGVQPYDFAGAYSLYHDGYQATLVLAPGQARMLRGTYSRRSPAIELPVTAEIREDVPHEIEIRIPGEVVGSAAVGEPDASALLTGWLFTRPKSAIAGWLDHGETRSGFYMTRFR
jgi:hypothetical protein